MHLPRSVTVAVALLFFVGLPLGRAQEAGKGEPKPAAPQTAEEKLEALEQKVKRLESKLERQLELGHQAAAAKASETPLVTAGKEGFSLRSPDGNFQLRLRGVVQADGRFYLNDDQKPNADTFLLRKVRPVFEGTVFKIFDFLIHPDFGGGTTVLQDAYLDARFLTGLQFQVGKFKAPFGLERLQRDGDYRMMERGLPTDLAPNRDVGAQLHGEFFSEGLTYAFGIFNGVADNALGDLETQDQKDFDGRIFGRPLQATGVAALEGLSLGWAGTIGRQDGTGALATYKSTGQATIFTYLAGATPATTVTADGIHYRLSPQGTYYWGSLGILGEYVLSSQEVRKGAREEKLDHRSWQVAASYIVTGEKNSFKGVDPKKPFDLQRNQWGALELLGRYNDLSFDDQSFPVFASLASSVRRAQAWGGGLNWYLNRNLKVSLDYEITRFHRGATGGDREDEQYIFTRFQISF